MSNFTPAWFKKGFFNESLFCDDFLSSHQLLYSNGAFFTPDGRMTDTMPLRCEIFEMMREYVGANLAKKVTNVVDVLKLAAQVEDFPPCHRPHCTGERNPVSGRHVSEGQAANRPQSAPGQI